MTASQSEFSPKKFNKAIHRALKLWNVPTLEGLDMFAALQVSKLYGFQPNSHIVDRRLAVNHILESELVQLARLQPVLANILLRRFKGGEAIKRIAFSLGVSEEVVNRSQKEAIGYLAIFLMDEEFRLKKFGPRRQI